MPAIKIDNDFYWVGAIDWHVRDFHGYNTFHGTTYNSYLLVDEKVVLFDSVKSGFFNEYLENIKQVLGNNPKIDYLVINHIEPDHSGSFIETVKTLKPEKIFCTKKGMEGLIAHFHIEDLPFEVVKPDTVLKTGKYTISFIPTAMIHWPDSMFSYINEKKILISQDAFGAHYATSTRFDDEVNFNILAQEVGKYYANIVMPYSAQVQRILQNIKSKNLEINMICPDHGVIWKKHVNEIIAAYDRWSKHEANNKVLIIYDTMWKSTEKMAYQIYKTILEEGLEAELFKLSVSDTTTLMLEVLRSKGIILGSPTLNNDMMPSMAAFTSYMKGLKPRKKIGFAFGSYGWSGEAANNLNKILEEMQTTITSEPIRVKYVPTQDDLKKCITAAKNLIKIIKEGE